MYRPHQKLLALDQEIREIQMLLGLTNERRVLQEEANQNWDRPFDTTHRLPPEIIADIFELCIPKGPTDYIIRTLFVLSAVCQRWRTISHSTPQLWKTLSIRVGFSSFPSSATLPILVQEWIDRTGELPLSIDLFVHVSGFNDLKPGSAAAQIIGQLNKCCHRWSKLKYTGPPSLLSYFPSYEQDLPQLRTLDLEVMHWTSPGFRDRLNLHPNRLNTLSMSGIMLSSMKFDWNYLTQLKLERVSLRECFEAFRRAPCITHCTFRHYSKVDLEQGGLPLPRNPIVHPKLQYLEISKADLLHRRIFQHLSCPSLKTIVLEQPGRSFQGMEMPLIMEFLKRSGFSLERLSLRSIVLFREDAALLCEGIPTLQHLNVTMDPYSTTPSNLFARLAEFSIVNGRKRPRYLPALHSLTLWDRTPISDWTMLTDVFGIPKAHSMERHRQALESVLISIAGRSSRQISGSLHEIDKETLKRILWLRETGVKLEVHDTQTGKDLIKLAIEWYNAV